jgi:molybdopterin molybdotransferase
LARAVIPLEEAQARLLALAKPVATEIVPIAEAAGRWIAVDVITCRTQPARALSAMDGYAVAASDGPWRLIGESAAGRSFAGRVSAGEAVRIFTGAIVPEGCDSIIIQENIAPEGEMISRNDGSDTATGDHVRPAGSDFRAGETLITAGTCLSPAHIALAAMGGYVELSVRRKIRVTLISTGDELVAPGEPSDDDHIPSSNGVMIAAMLSGLPVILSDPGIIPDQLEATVEAIRAARDSDVIVTIGGASVGDHDLVRPALLQAGATLNFWKVAMRPGKPVMVGQFGNAITLGLPGNPVSAYVTALLFLKPLIAALSGAKDAAPHRESAILAADLAACGPRTDHVRARFINGHVTPVGMNDSAALKSLAASDALIVRQPNVAAASSGDIVDIIRTA